MSFNLSFSGIGTENDEEDDFGSLSSNSNLASIFSQDVGSSQLNKKSLMYTAPKQPTHPANTQPSQVVITAAAVACYKLANEKYEPILGKMGLALLAENGTKTFRIVLYQNKQKPLATAKITSNFVLSSQPDNFCTFYDDRKQNWAVLFDSKQVAQQFVTEVERVKMRSSTSNKGNGEETAAQVPAEAAPRPSRVDESSKNKLMSRIAKMGQPILALSGPLIAENSDSDQAMQSLTTETERPKLRKSRPPPKPTTNEHPVNSMIVPAQYNTVPSGIPMNMMQYIPAFNPASNSVHFDTLLSETRTQNSEIRMHLCRLSDKVDLSLQKSGMNDSQPEMNPSILTSIEGLRSNMMAQFQVLSGQSSAQMSKLERVLEWIETKQPDNPMYNSGAQDKEESDRIIQQLKEENNRLLLRNESTSLEYQQRIDKLEHQLKGFELKCAESENQLSQFQKDSEIANQQLKQLEKQIVELQTEEKNPNRTLHSDLPEQVKTIMNKVYKASLKQFRPEETYSFHSIKSTLSLVIRDVTLAMLNGEVVEKSPVEKSPVEKVPVEKVPAEEPTVEKPPVEKVPVEKVPAEEPTVEKPPVEKPSVEKPQMEIQLIETQPLSTQPESLVAQMKDHKVESTEEERNQVKDNLDLEEDARDKLPVDAPSDESLSSTSKQIKENPISYMESIQNSLAAAKSHIQDWKPEPPPLFEDFNEEDDWLM